MSLREYGWDDFFESDLGEDRERGLEPGRVLATVGSPRLITAAGERRATVAGRLSHQAKSAAELPAVGDWVAYAPVDAVSGRIERVLTRRTCLSRKAPGTRTDEQVVAANVDTVLVVMGLDGDFNIRRLERLLATVWESGAVPVVVLTKIDLCDETAARVLEVEAISSDLPVLAINGLLGEGVAAVRRHIESRRTAALIGSSGAGKSTLINRLLGEEVQKTAAVRDGDDRGRHTTTHRELFRIEDGGLLIDNPGIREVQLWAGDESVSRAFEDIAELAEECRYRDCTHHDEPGCAVVQAAADGRLEADRLQSYRNLQKEVRYLELRQDESSQRIQKRKWRAIHKEKRRSGKHRKR